MSGAKSSEPGFNDLARLFAEQELFADKSWVLSPKPFPLPESLFREVEKIGNACLDFQIALERLYLRSVEGRRILRNEELLTPWVADYFDRGKSSRLLEHGRHPNLKGSYPVVLRPDVLLTEDGLAVTEIDAVPGGIGLTAFLNRYFSTFSDRIVGARDSMLDAFWTAVTGKLNEVGASSSVAIVVSKEAETYLPEMKWLAGELQRKGHRILVCSPSDLMPLAESICVSVDGEPQKIDVIYRFWELFDLPNVDLSDVLMDAVEQGEISLTPPMRAFQEEKLALALFHHPRLADYWKEQLSGKTLRILSRVFPRSWVVDPAEVGPNGVLHAPPVQGRAPFHWEELAAAGKRERNLILKLSGFHERAWGARSVTLGNDVSRDDWRDALRQAVSSGERNPYVLQEYRKPKRIRHPYYDSTGQLSEGDWRVRLCPYFFRNGDGVSLDGILATLCPADKKIIHGMSDAVLLPVERVDDR